MSLPLGTLHVIDALERGDADPSLLHHAAQLLRSTLDPLPSDHSNLFRPWIQNLPVGAAFLDTQLRYVHVNPAFAAIFARRPEDITGHSLHHIITTLLGPKFAPQHLAQCTNALQVGHAPILLAVPLGPLGDLNMPRSFDWDVRRVNQTNGNPLGLIVTLTEASQLQSTSHIQPLSEKTLQTLAEIVPDIIFTLHPSAQCTFMSPRWYHYTGMEPPSAQGDGWLAAFHPDDLDRYQDVFQLARPLHQPSSFPLRLRAADGNYRWFVSYLKPLIDPHGNLLELAGAFTDIDELKQTQQALLASETRNYSLLRFVPDLMFRLDHNAVFLDYLTGSEDSLFVPPDQFLGKPVDTVLPPDIASQVRRLIAEVLQTRQMRILDYALTIHGQPRHFEARIISADSAEVFAIIRDLTTQKLAEQALLQNAEQLRAAKLAAEAANKTKDRFISLLSHELRTPLTPILLSVASIEQDPALPPSIREQLATIHSQVQLEARLIDDLLNLVDTSRDNNPGPSTIRLPSFQTNKPAATPANPPPDSPSRTLTILLVEDHRPTANLLAQLLTMLGHRVQTASNIRDALQIARSNPFQLLIADIDLPDGTGIQLIQQLQEHRPPHAIAISGFGAPQHIADSHNAGFALHLTKPISFQQLQNTIDSLTAQSPSNPSSAPHTWHI